MRPANWYCFDFMISLYFVKASWIIELASRHNAWFKATANERSTLIKSAKLAFYFNFLNCFYLFVASLAFYKASIVLPKNGV